MNAEEFYEDFKSALVFLGLRWGDMNLATVSIEGDCVCISYAGKSALIESRPDAAKAALEGTK